ncbi:hypothetical protein ACGH52_00685 [Streptomyces sp. BBFR25]|uniref:hypothetical protein n=1 Tax=Streptomyces sp. BBFR25 TaxID=3372855 RepID=UPI0037DD0277
MTVPPPDSGRGQRLDGHDAGTGRFLRRSAPPSPPPGTARPGTVRPGTAARAGVAPHHRIERAPREAARGVTTVVLSNGTRDLPPPAPRNLGPSRPPTRAAVRGAGRLVDEPRVDGPGPYRTGNAVRAGPVTP